jgi:hypothetical protein
LRTEGGYGVESIRAITGAPVFTFDTLAIGSEGNPSLDEVFDTLYLSNSLKYIMSAGTYSGSDSTLNKCGIPNGHSFSLLEAFNLTESSGDISKMLMFRNPWGKSKGVFNGSWSYRDRRWN